MGALESGHWFISMSLQPPSSWCAIPFSSGWSMHWHLMSLQQRSIFLFQRFTSWMTVISKTVQYFRPLPTKHEDLPIKFTILHICSICTLYISANPSLTLVYTIRALLGLDFNYQMWIWSTLEIYLIGDLSHGTFLVDAWVAWHIYKNAHPFAQGLVPIGSRCPWKTCT